MEYEKTDYDKIEAYEQISHRQVIEQIIRTEGKCLSIVYCLSCPFAEKCIFKAITGDGLLDINKRVAMAKDMLFGMLVDDELE